MSSRYHAEVAKLFPELPPLTPAQKEYARTHRPDRKALFNKGEIWCPDCGRIVTRDIPRGQIADLREPYTCPCCGTKSTLVYSRKQHVSRRAFFTVIQMFRGWQVVRHYLCLWVFYKDQEPFFGIDEVVQSWITPDGRHEVPVARPRANLGGSESFVTSKPLAVRRYNHPAYCIWGKIIYPHAQVLPMARRNGFCMAAACDALAPSELIRKLLQSDRYPHVEMLVKIKQYPLARYLADYGFEDYAAEIRICHRNRYIVREAGLWCDYIRMLRRVGRDTRNARYTCPRNLKKAHDALQERIHREENKRRLADSLERAKKDERKYALDKGAYFGIAFGDAVIQISVFRTVADIAREGTEMHHCVFAAGYHRRKNSLLLSARDKSGKHVETIEVDLTSCKVVQSRGKCNSNSPHHDRILRLMARNMHLIEAVRGTVTV